MKEGRINSTTNNSLVAELVDSHSSETSAAQNVNENYPLTNQTLSTL